MKLTRREFGVLTTGALALAQDSGRKIGYCAVGLGRISGIFMSAVKLSSQARMVALVSGYREKAEKIAEDYGIAAKNIYSYDNFDSIADNPEIDAVYIGLPNSMHAEYTIRGARAGKHVLCEKPMAVSVADCQSMIDACRRANKKLMIGYRIQYEPVVHARALELIRGGQLGAIQTIEGAYGFNISPSGATIKGVNRPEFRINAALAGGGPMMDVGIYALNTFRYLMGEEPAELTASTSVIDKDGRFNGIEENMVWTMKFPSGAVASCATTYGASLGPYFRIVGSKGTLLSEPSWNYDGMKMTVRLQGQPPAEVTNPERHPAQFVREADHFAECILQNKEPKTPGEEGMRDMKHIAELYRVAGRKA
jgi:predicted dehydrogenase